MSLQNDFFEDVAERERQAQFRMHRLQVYNWGTFSNLHDIAIAERGFLFVGRSGSGKSTLLDAIATLLTPPQWLAYNAAAREGERSRRDRNLASYVRGAWGDRTDNASGEIATHFLRRGATWSALALTFANGEGRKVTLVHIYWIGGSGTATSDVRRHYLIAERDFDIASELDGFDLDLRALKRRLPDVDHFGNTFRPYGERFRRLLEIESEQALKLLHKTQSAKNLGDLNTFLREFMLERPDTFEAAERLVAEFAELDAAHREVVEARRQVETLGPAREEHRRLGKLDGEIAGHERLLEAVDAWTEARRVDLLRTAMTDNDARIVGLEGEIRQAEAALDQARSELRSLEAEHRARGGDRIEALEDEARRLEIQREERQIRRQRIEADCRVLGWPLPTDAAAFGRLLVEAREYNEARESVEEAEQARRDRLRDLLREKEAEFTALRREIEAMERQSSNLPAGMLELRGRIAEAIGCGDAELPFVGELLQVREEAAEWQGAIERVLHGFALSLLVDEARYPALSDFVDRTHLGHRLVYYRVPAERLAGGRAPGPHSLVRKLELRETIFRPWLETELLRRFDYTCVEHLRDFRREERALTRTGQVRHGQVRHEKDDRWAIDDRRRWVLGFDNREKQAYYRLRAGELGAEIGRLQQELEALRQARQQERQRFEASVRVANAEWQGIDLGSVLDRLAEIERDLAALRQGDAVLRALGERLQAQRDRLETQTRRLEDLRVALRTTQVEQARLGEQRREAEAHLESCPRLDDAARAGLEQRFHQSGETTLKNLEKRRHRVEGDLQRVLKEQREARAASIRRMEKAFVEFKREWAEAAADMDTTLESAPDYLRLLERIEQDGLPRHERRFFDMLRQQSGERLAALNRHLSEARKEIHDRMESVNEGLAEAEFNPGTLLQIEVHDRQLADVVEFRRQVKEILAHAWQADPGQAERRFERLEALVGRLGGEATEDRRWRDLVLDVRLHVEFVGRELDRDTGEEVEIYRSGAGKSGGQREKLATTCLAAALRYQLGGSDNVLPRYAAVVLDEAFGKADNEFTELAMRIFERFGFQMVVATPLKSVMTLEPFIGGACFVEISERRDSRTLSITYDEATGRLDLPAPRSHGERASA